MGVKAYTDIFSGAYSQQTRPVQRLSEEGRGQQPVGPEGSRHIIGALISASLAAPALLSVDQECHFQALPFLQGPAPRRGSAQEGPAVGTFIPTQAFCPVRIMWIVSWVPQTTWAKRHFLIDYKRKRGAGER